MLRSCTHLLLATSSHVACLSENDGEIIRVTSGSVAGVSVDLNTAPAGIHKGGDLGECNESYHVNGSTLFNAVYCCRLLVCGVLIYH
jgi:hypothetical protein